MTFLRRLLDTCERRPDAPALTFLGTQPNSLTRESLLLRCASVAAQVCERSEPSDRVLVALPWGEAQVAALLGVLFAGRVAVPAPADRGPLAVKRLRTIAADAGCRFAFAHVDIGSVPVCQPRLDQPASLTVPPAGPAVLQYTSGSTAQPKGVQLHSRNIDANLTTIARAFDQSPEDVLVGWLPLFHDMGLFGTLLHPVCSGQHAILMSPRRFISRPAQLLRALSDYRASTCGGPDFGFAWLANRVTTADLDGIDLSNWRVAFTGSEPISPATLERFTQRFEPCGFRPQSFTPCYGLAESTLLVTAARPDDAVRIVDGRVSCGRPQEEVAITAPDGTLVVDGAVGEIRVRGPSVAHGYHGVADGDVFDTRTSDGRRGWLRTGDLGLMCEGELFIAGRLKDLIVLRGENHHPHDLEMLVDAALPGAKSCAFALPGRAGESVGLVLETNDAGELAVAAARRALRTALGIEPEVVGVLRGRNLPRTTSGKMQRKACRDAWLDGSLPLRHRWPTEDHGRPLQGPWETSLAGLWSDLLGVEVTSANTSFFSLGGASLLAVELACRIESTFGVSVAAHELLAASDLETQAQLIELAPHVGPPPLDPAVAPLSLQQEGLLILGQFAETSQPPVSVDIDIDVEDGEVDIDAIFDMLVARHPVLSTRVGGDGSLTERVDWRIDDGVPSLQRGQPFTVFRRGRRLTLSWDHAVIDGWSVRILLEEFAALLDARALPPAPPSGLAFARAQRDNLFRGGATAALAFHGERWASSRIALPFARSDDTSAGLYRKTLGDEGALQATAESLGTTFAQLALAAIAVVLARLSDQETVRIGIPLHNREAPWQRTVGCLVSMQLASIDVDATVTGRELLAAIAQELTLIRRHSLIPLESLPARLGVARRETLADVVFDHLSLPARIGRLRLHHGSVLKCPDAAKVPLTITALETDQVELVFLYRRGFLGDEFVAELADQVALALRALTEQVDTRCRSWSLRTPRAADLLPLSQHPLPVPSFPLIHDKTINAPSEAIAIVQNGHEYTYGNLRSHALTACGTLHRAGIGPGDVVGILGSASFSTIAAMLGTLAAGAVILSLDRRLPPGRLALMVRETGAKCVVQGDGHHEQDDRLGAPLLTVSGPPGTPMPVRQADPAYVVFTTGSTRAPKAVLGTHRGLAHFLNWQARTFDVGPADRFVVLTNLAFDMALRDVWLPLTCGAALLIPDDAVDVDAAGVVRQMRQFGVTRLHLVPTLARSWLQTVPPTQLDMLRSVFFAGEPLTDSLVQRFRQHFTGDYEVLNFYGPSETTQTKIFFRVPDPPEPGVQAIGRPLPETSVTLLNAAMEPCGIGEAGEIVIRTPFATRGYMNAPDEQAQRFTTDPSGSGELVYRSGDIGQLTMDGTINILGRGDAQVKVRGVAVHPSEVSDLISSLAGVRQVAVVARPTEQGDHELLAWFAADRSWPQLRAELTDLLPGALIPGRASQLDALPTHPNGKVDTRSLPLPQVGAPVPEEQPKDLLETTVLRLWREVLGDPNLGMSSGFLDSGGHSLTALEFVASVRRELGRELSPALLLKGNTAHAVLSELATAAPSIDEIPELVADPDAAFEPFPMTRVQEAYWVGRREFLELGNAAAQTYRELRCPVDLDLSRLGAAFTALVERHPMLRTLATPDGRQRVIATVPPFAIPSQDLRQCDAADADARIHEWRGEMSHRVRSLEEWPLLEVRASLLPNEVRLHFGVDVFICDAWSRVLLLNELRTFFTDPTAELDALGVTFRDYVVCQQNRPLDAAWAWWRLRLDELPPPPRLPLSRGTHGEFTRRSGVLSAQDWVTFCRHATAAGVTPSAALLAAYGWVLARWSAQDRLTVNVTAFARLPVHPDINKVIGDFTSVFPHTMQSDWSCFKSHARAEQTRLWQELAHAEISGVDLAREHARRSGSLNATGFPVVFTSALVAPELGEGFDWSWLGELVHGISQTPQVWLDNQVYEHKGELHYNWDYVDALFEEGVLDAMFDAWGRLLRALVDAPWTAAPIDLMPPDQRSFIDSLNATAAPRTDQTLVDGVLAAAAEHPGEAAIIAPECTLSFEELVGEAERVAAALIDAGVARGDLVAILAPHGWRQAVATLGIVLAGAAYLPVSLDQPAARVQQILDEAQPRLIVRTSQAWREGIDLEALPARRARRLPRPDDLAYVIFTSGSTGRPKGVSIRHKMAVNTLVDVARRCELGQEHRAIALSAISFDLSVWDLFGSWRLAAAVVYPQDRSDPHSWVKACDQHAVKLWNSVPMMAQMLLDAVESESELAVPASLDRVLLSGDWIPVSLAGRVRDVLPNAKLWSLGGATEGSIWSIAYRVNAVNSGWQSVPYGTALANQTMEILDEGMRPCPLYVSGRIYIGGEGVADGYWQDPERTAERFVEHNGRRLYDTGDLGRWLADGQMEILGRVDTQVKVRGHRVELGEIEHAIEAHCPVTRAAVLALGDATGPKRLAAFVVSCDAAADVSQFATRLANVLPDYMIPRVWRCLDAMPLTSNGKLDRAALHSLESEPDASVHEDSSSSVVARAWEKLLGRPPSGPDANFFMVGGDSVTWLRLCAEVSRAGWHLPTSAIATDASLAWLNSQLRAPEEIAIPEGIVPLAPMQSWLVKRGLPERFNQAILLEFRQPIMPEHLRYAVSAAAAAHPAFGTRVDACGQRFEAVEPIWETADVLNAEGIDHACRGFDLGGPLLRTTHFVDHLLLCSHHLACDAHSWGVLVADLEVALAALQAGNAVDIPREPVPFAAWCHTVAGLAEVGATPSAPGGDAVVPSNATAPLTTIRRVLAITPQALASAGEHQRCSAEELFVAAAAAARVRTEQQGHLELERNGRSIDGLDCSRTVGWLTALVPIHLTQASPVDLLVEAKSVLRALPDGGLGLAASHIARGTDTGLVVNFLGTITATESPYFRLRRDVILPIMAGSGNEIDNQSRLTLYRSDGDFVAELRHAGSGERLLDALDEALVELTGAPMGAATASVDFPDSDLPDDELSDLFASQSGTP